MAKKLLIVESPAKAKTIGKYLGKDFKVLSSKGHIRDLNKEGMGIDIDNNFKPHYSVSSDKRKVVSELKKEVKKSEEVWLATDEDREGEAISWHLCKVLGLAPEETKRIVFHEITNPAIQKAIESPRKVDMNLVDAQQARRVLDRLVGFEISPVLWRKLSGKSLSAGRVQSVAVKVLAEREREINKFIAKSNYRVEGLFKAKDKEQKDIVFKAEGNKFKEDKAAKEFLEQCIKASYKVTDIQVKPGKKRPTAPFTTSTLQQEASRKLGYAVSRTMRVAQQLYENGHISYMRTDSVNLSQTAIKSAEEVIRKKYGAQYHKSRQYKTKSKGAQEAHEAIRPTNLRVTQVGNAQNQKLYNLIWKRTIASQMAEAQTEKTTATINISTIKEDSEHHNYLTAKGEVVTFDGFLKVYNAGKDEDDQKENSSILPPLKEGQILPLVELNAIERFNRPPARYTEASLVKRLEEMNIGRPSTYAPTISTIQNRGYVEKKSREGHKRDYQILQLKDGKITDQMKQENTGVEKNKLFPTDLGLVVTDFLNKHFDQVMDYGFTADIENQFDEIASGGKVWNEMLGSFYKPFHRQVEDTLAHAEYSKGEHELGTDPKTGKPVVARLGRFGPMVQIGSAEDEEKPQYASIKPGQSIETITLEEALDLFKLPFDLEDYDGENVKIGAGRYGPYVKWGRKYISIPKGEDPLSVNQNRAIELIEERKKADAPITSFKDKPVTKGVGRFGPYLKYDGLFVNVPKKYNFDNLSQGEIEELIEAKLEKEANRYIQRWEDQKVAIENGRWGPFIRFKKKSIKLGKKENGEKYTQEELKELSLDDVKKIIETNSPGTIKKKKNTRKKTTKTKSKAKKK
ncbi:MAG TPA: type I DNA topoisomerase [Chitinophagaceae bacterium]|nr:type I DNA topoisomerase [Chitinophagaceae bacterium]